MTRPPPLPPLAFYTPSPFPSSYHLPLISFQGCHIPPKPQVPKTHVPVKPHPPSFPLSVVPNFPSCPFFIVPPSVVPHSIDGGGPDFRRPYPPPIRCPPFFHRPLPLSSPPSSSSLEAPKPHPPSLPLLRHSPLCRPSPLPTICRPSPHHLSPLVISPSIVVLQSTVPLESPSFVMPLLLHAPYVAPPPSCPPLRHSVSPPFSSLKASEAPPSVVTLLCCLHSVKLPQRPILFHAPPLPPPLPR